MKIAISPVCYRLSVGSRSFSLPPDMLDPVAYRLHGVHGGLKPGRASARPSLIASSSSIRHSGPGSVLGVRRTRRTGWRNRRPSRPPTCLNRPGHEQLQLVPARGRLPVAYGELNLLDQQPRRCRDICWLPRSDAVRRGAPPALVERAFHHAAAASRSWFPDNAAARACYYRAGLREDGWEVHYLPPYGRRVRLLRMSIKRPAQLAVPSF